MVMQEKLKISKKNKIKGDDGYKVFSVRIKDSTVQQLETLTQTTNRSRNELINMLLEYALEYVEIE